MIYFDIDGVVRNFGGKHLPHPPNTWIDFPQGFFEYVEKNKEEIFYLAPIFSPMVKMINTLPSQIEFKFLTNQKGDQEKEKYTTLFIEKHFKKPAEVEFVTTFDEKLERLSNHFLFDDYPDFYKSEKFFNKKNNVILVCREWNMKERKHYRYLLNPNTLTIIDTECGLEETAEKFICSL